MSEVSQGSGNSSSPATPHEAAKAGSPQNTGKGTDSNAIIKEVFNDEDLALEAEQLGVNGKESMPKQIDKAVKSGDLTKKEGQALKKQYKIKVNGKEETVDFDLSNDDAVIKELQKSRAFDVKSKEFSTKSQQFDEIMQMLQRDPESVLEKLGLDVDQIAEKRLEKAVEKMKKSPEQLEQEKLRFELETLKKEKEQAQKEREMAQLEQYKNQVASEINSDIQTSLDSAKSFLPKNADTLERVARYMFYAMENGHPTVTAKEVLPLVEREYKEQLRRTFDASPEEIIEMLVGEDNINRLRKKRIAAQRNVRTETARQVAKDTGKTTNQQEREKAEKDKKKPKSFSSFFKD